MNTTKFNHTDLVQEEHNFKDDKYDNFQEDPNLRYGFYSLNDGEQRLNYNDEDKYIYIIKLYKEDLYKNGTLYDKVIFEIRNKKNDKKSGLKTYDAVINRDFDGYEYVHQFSWNNYDKMDKLPIDKLRTNICKSRFLYTRKK